MRTERTLARLSVKADGPELRRAARDIGHAMDGVTPAFRSSLARIDDEGCDVFVLGYRAALADVLAAHADASAVSITGWSPLAKGVVAALAENGPMEPAQLAEEFGAAPAAVSRALAKLLRQRLVRRTTVGVGGDHRRKPVQLTARGRTLLHDREASAPPPESETGHE